MEDSLPKRGMWLHARLHRQLFVQFGNCFSAKARCILRFLKEVKSTDIVYQQNRQQIHSKWTNFIHKTAVVSQLHIVNQPPLK